MKVEVVDVRNYGRVPKKLSEHDYYIYCGCPSQLGNPSLMQDELQRNIVIERYAKDTEWDKVLEDFYRWVKTKRVDNLKIGCFCTPKDCHCNVIKARLERI